MKTYTAHLEGQDRVAAASTVHSGRNGSQRGMASIVITLITMVVISLIVLGFATISRREQRQTLDQQLSAQAFYAAESAVEDARHVIRTALQNGDEVVGKANCTSNDAGGTYPIGNAMTLDADNNVSYTCLKVNVAPGQLVYDGVGEDGVVVPIRAPAATDRVEISWRPSTPPSGTPAGCPNRTDNVFSPQLDWNCDYGLVRVDLVPTAGAMTRAGLMGGQFSGFFVPSSTNAGGNISYNGNRNRPTAERARCGTATYTQCTMTINGLGAANEFALRINSLYRTSDITVTSFANNGSMNNIIGTQIEVDATGKAQDVLRRIKVRIPVRGSGEVVPSYAIQSSGSICKRFAAAPNYFRIPADITEQDPTNAMCQPRISAPPGPPPPPACTAVADIQLIVDTSTSMLEDWDTGTRWDKMRETARRFVQDSALGPATNHMALLPFGEAARVDVAYTSNTGTLISGVNTLDLDDDDNETRYSPALTLADSYRASGRAGVPKTIVFISDGAPEDNKQTIRNQANALKAAGVKIYTIAIGDPDTDPAYNMDEQLMIDMAGGGGTFGNAKTEAQLDSIIQAIANDMSCI